jgi:signal transduction histidine kinase
MRLLLISLVAIGAILVLSVFLYMQRRKTYQQNLLTLKREQDISLLKALMTGEEKERSRLARELHDGLGGILAAAQMQISQAGPVQQSDGIQKAADLVSQAAVESRRIAHNLLPETLLRYGLDEALRGYCKSITDSKLLQVDYQSQGMDARLEQSVELSIYRIVQELINNIVKHAGASEAFVQVQRNGDSLAITVEDDGKGFAPTRKEGIGLSNISSRISYLNGTMDIKSGQQKGTSVFIEIQLNKYAAG